MRAGSSSASRHIGRHRTRCSAVVVLREFSYLATCASPNCALSWHQGFLWPFRGQSVQHSTKRQAVLTDGERGAGRTARKDAAAPCPGGQLGDFLHHHNPFVKEERHGKGANPARPRMLLRVQCSKAEVGTQSALYPSTSVPAFWDQLLSPRHCYCLPPHHV